MGQDPCGGVTQDLKCNNVKLIAVPVASSAFALPRGRSGAVASAGKPPGGCCSMRVAWVPAKAITSRIRMCVTVRMLQGSIGC